MTTRVRTLEVAADELDSGRPLRALRTALHHTYSPLMMNLEVVGSSLALAEKERGCEFWNREEYGRPKAGPGGGYF